MKHLPIILALLTGCASPPTCKQPLQVQRTDDLDHECERCGDIAVENVSEVADEENWRCAKCKPRDVMPRRTIRPKKLERNMA